MNIDLLPLAALAMESSRRPERPRGGFHTLTLPAPRSAYEQPMSGSAEIEATPLPSGSLLRAAVLPAEGPALTITF